MMLRVAKQAMGILGVLLSLVIGGVTVFSSELLQAWCLFELSHVGHEVSWEALHREDGGFCLEELCVVLDELSGEGVEAHRLYVFPTFDVWNGHLILAIEGEGVALKLLSDKLLQGWQGSWPSWLRLSILPVVRGGTFVFLCQEGGEQQKTIPFELSSALQDTATLVSVTFPEHPDAKVSISTLWPWVQKVRVEHLPVRYLDPVMRALDVGRRSTIGCGTFDGAFSFCEGSLTAGQLAVSEADFALTSPSFALQVHHFSGRALWEGTRRWEGAVREGWSWPSLWSWEVEVGCVEVSSHGVQGAFGGRLAFSCGALSTAHLVGQVEGIRGSLTYAGSNNPLALQLEGSVGQAATLGGMFHKELGLMPWKEQPILLSLELFSFEEGMIAQGDVEVGEPSCAAANPLQFSVSLPPLHTLWEQDLIDTKVLADWASSSKACLFAKDLALGSYISFWMERLCGVTLEGVASFKAICDGRGYHVTCEPTHLSLDHQRFSVVIPKSVSSHSESGEFEFSSSGGASHLGGIFPHSAIRNLKTHSKMGSGVRPYFQGSWDHGMTLGGAFLEGALYVEKNTGLVFEDICAMLSYQDRQLSLEEVRTRCQGIVFEGRLQMQWKPDGQMTLQIASPHYEGSCVDFAALIGKMAPQIGWQDLLAGRVISRDAGLFMQVTTGGDKAAVLARLEGSLEEVEAFLPVFGGAVCGLQADFVYEYPSQALTIREVVAKMGVAGRRAPEMFSLYSPQIFFPNLFSDVVEFDLCSGLESQVQWRLLGKTHAGSDDEGQAIVQVALDPAVSHIGSLQPNIELLELGSAKVLKKLKAHPRLDLAAFRHSIDVLVNVGWLPASSGLFCSLSAMEGDLDAQVAYDISRGWDFSVRGERLILEGQEAMNFSLKGSCHEGRWCLNSLRFDDFAMTSEFEYVQETWNVSFLGMRLADALFLGMQGTFDGQRQVLTAQLTQLEVDLDKLASLPRFSSFKELLAPSGKIRAEGEVELDLSHPTSWTADATVDLSVRDLEICGIQVTLDHHIRCCYSSEEGLSTRGACMQLALKEGFPKAKVAVALKSGSYQMATDLWQIEGLQFDIPIQDFYAFSQTFSSVAQRAEEVPLWLRELKPDGKIQGQLSAVGQGKDLQMRCELADGEYLLGDRKWRIEQLCLEYMGGQWHLQGQVEYQGEYFFTVLQPEGMPWRQGVLLVSQPVRHKEQTMQIDWKMHESGQVVVSKISGLCHGVAATLHRPLDDAKLKGRVTLTAPEVVSLFPKSIAETLLSWEVSGRGTLEGDWEICADKGIVFDGEFQSPALSLLECTVHNLSGRVSFDEAHVEFKDVMLQDRAGVLSVPSLSLAAGAMGGWHVQIPHLTLQHLRPDLLLGKEKAKRSLVITQADLYKVQGDLSRLQTLTGRGCAQFVYPSSGSFLGGLFVIPADILSRIGFDLSVLSPVSGKVHYTLQDAKLYLTSFEDMYSQGKRSKFYLAKGQYHSYIDFAGKLNVFVRMKQYNLVFKMAELFMIQVEGTLGRPSYSLLPSRACYSGLEGMEDGAYEAQAL